MFSEKTNNYPDYINYAHRRCCRQCAPLSIHSNRSQLMALIGSTRVRRNPLLPLVNGNYVLLGIMPHVIVDNDTEENIFLNVPVFGRLDKDNKKVVSVHKAWRSDIMERAQPCFDTKGVEHNNEGDFVDCVTRLWLEGEGTHEIVGWLDDILPAVRDKILTITRDGFSYTRSDGGTGKKFCYKINFVDGKTFKKPTSAVKSAIEALAKKLTPKGVEFYLDGLDWDKGAKDYTHIGKDGHALSLSDDGTFAEEGED